MTVLEELILSYDKNAITAKESEDLYEVTVVDKDGNQYSYEVLEDDSEQYYTQRDSTLEDIRDLVEDAFKDSPYPKVENIIKYYLDDIPMDDLGYEYFHFNMYDYWIRKL